MYELQALAKFLFLITKHIPFCVINIEIPGFSKHSN